MIGRFKQGTNNVTTSVGHVVRLAKTSTTNAIDGTESGDLDEIRTNVLNDAKTFFRQNTVRLIGGIQQHHWQPFPVPCFGVGTTGKVLHAPFFVTLAQIHQQRRTFL